MVCGSADGQTVTTKPTTHLCAVGTATAVSGDHQRLHGRGLKAGSGGGTTVQCRCYGTATAKAGQRMVSRIALRRQPPL